LTGIGPHVRSLACPSCGHWVFVTDGAWTDGGRFAHALDAPPLLRVGRALVLDGSARVVAGRVRLGDEESHWDEWWLTDETGEGLWLEEDGGRYLLHESVAHAPAAGAFRALGVGQTFEAGGIPWFVTESFVARVLGAEGELPVAFDVRESVRCLDALADGRELSVEIWGEEVSASIAMPLDAARLLVS